MSRLARFVITCDAVLLVLAVAAEFTSAGPISRWWDGHPYQLLAPGGYALVYHLAYLILCCVFPAVHLIALLTKERILITGQR